MSGTIYCLKWWRLGDCLARSRLTAVPCFVFRAKRPYNKSTPASAHSRSDSLNAVAF